MATEPSPLELELIESIEKVDTIQVIKPKLIKSNLKKRKFIILSYWLILLIGLPFWFNSTKIERLNLPNNLINYFIKKSPCYLIPEIDLKITSLLNPIGTRLISTIISNLEKEFSTKECIKFKVNSSDLGSFPIETIREGDIGIIEESKYRYELVLGDENKLGLERKGVALLDGASREKSIANAKTVATTLLDLKSSTELDPRVVKFSSNYKLVFNLLNQDSSSGHAILDWDIETLLARHIQPLLNSLAPLHNFTIETSIQYFAPLTINIAKSTIEGGEEGSTIDEIDLKAFVNPADWNMPSSETLDPILQFIVYVPSPKNRPLNIKQSSGSISLSNAFITPQWGGIAIFNPSLNVSSSLEGDNQIITEELSIPFRHFEQQLFQLLGVPTSPPSFSPSIPHPTQRLASWQIDAMIRRRLKEASKECIETLGALVKLIEDIPNMRVGEEVLRDVKASLNQLDLAELNLHLNPSLALSHVASALRLASRAYFNPTMLALLYFPQEHKYAVYCPFFGPIMVPMLSALFKEFKEWKERRNRRLSDMKDRKEDKKE